LLKEIDDVNDTSEGCTVLEVAILVNNDELMKLLVDIGSDGTVCGDSCDIFRKVVRCHNNAMLQVLLSRNNDILSIQKHSLEKNILQFAADAGDMEIVRLLIDSNEGLDDVESKAPYALLAAVTLGDADRVRIYVKNGVNFEKCNALRLYPLVEACSKGDEDIATILLEGGANVDENGRHLTALGEAIRKRNLNLVRALLDRGADEAGCAIYSERLCSWLDHRLTGLMLASLYAYPEIVREILSRGVDVNHANNNGKTALFYCSDLFKTWALKSTAGIDISMEIITLLLRAGARTDVPIGEESSTLLEYYLKSMLLSHTEYKSSEYDLIVPTAMIKASGITGLSLECFLNIMDKFLALPDNIRQRLFTNRNSYEAFYSTFKLAVLCGLKPTSKFIKMYENVLQKDIGRNKERTDWMTDIEKNGYTLMQITRMRLRHLIRCPLPMVPLLDDLPIPTLLKKYIALDDVF
jgi:ankyrin repeat protein